MKIIFSIFLLVISQLAFSQQLPLFEEDFGTNKNLKIHKTFKQSVKKAESYFSGIDTDKKGSGYKPFKRWEYHWSYYLQNDGSIAPAERLWQAWQQKNELQKSSKTTSNWIEKGPFDQSSKSGQGRINTILVDPNDDDIIYIGAPAGGLWKSIDSGVNWTPLTDHLPQIGVSGIAIDPNNSNIVYISTGDDDGGDSYSIGVLKSTDGGATWNFTGSILGSPISSNEIVIDPTNSNRIWVATSNGLFLSNDAGGSWTQKLQGHIRDFKLKTNNPNIIYAVSSTTFYKSINGGDDFSILSSGLPNANDRGRMRVEVTSNAPNNVYLLIAKPRSKDWAFEGVYISTNEGVSFAKTLESNDIFGSSQAWYDLAFCISDTDPEVMHVGVLDIWKSTDNGDDFEKTNDWRVVNESFTHADIHFMRYYNGVLYAGTDGGIYRSTDQGETFTDLTKNLSISQFYKITVSKRNSSKLAGGLQDNGGFSFNNDIWHNYHGGDGMDTASDPTDENRFYGFSQFGGILTVTNDNGLNSNIVTSSPVQGNWVTPLVSNKIGDIFAGYDQLYELKNNTWSKLSDENFADNIETIEIDPSNNDNIYLSIRDTLYKSTTRGQSFTKLTPSQTGIGGSFISSIEVHSTNSNILWITTSGFNPQFASSGHTGGGVYKSTDGGLTFENITGNLPNESKLVVRHHPFSTNNSIYIGTALGVYHRNDDINTWEVFSTNLPNVAVTDLEVNPYDNTITASTYGRSVWQSNIPSITLPINDADLVKILSPNNSVACDNVSSSIIVANNGANQITSLTINYNIDDTTEEEFSWTGVIEPNETKTIELPIISASEGVHTFNVELLNNDENIFNNNSSVKFNVNQNGEGQVIYTFGDINPGTNENNTAWLTSGDQWEIGTPTTTNFNELVESGYVTNPSGNYSDNTIAYLTSPCYNITTLIDPFLRFKMAFDIELNWDVLYMQYSTNNGATWQVLGTANDPNWYNSSFQSSSRPLTIGKQWTGLDSTLKEYSYDLSEFDDQKSMMFRFVFASDPAVNGEGALIDDFRIDASQVIPDNEELDTADIMVYPNPSQDLFNIERTNFLDKKMNIRVYDLAGSLIMNIEGITQNNFPLDMSAISRGIYFMSLNIEDKSLVKKLILE